MKIDNMLSDILFLIDENLYAVFALILMLRVIRVRKYQCLQQSLMLLLMFVVVFFPCYFDVITFFLMIVLIVFFKYIDLMNKIMRKF